MCGTITPFDKEMENSLVGNPHSDCVSMKTACEGKQLKETNSFMGIMQNYSDMITKDGNVTRPDSGENHSPGRCGA